MILIADSGSTKTNWRLVDAEKNTHSYATQGINPYFQNKEEISIIIAAELKSQLTIHLSDLTIFFYGAGCGAPDKNETLTAALLSNFNGSTVEVNNDMLGAARALCGNNKGIAAILGTGSNSCFYDGSHITERIGGYGYILGDEGSGAHIGKTFIKAYLNNQLPKQVADKFYHQFKLKKEDIMDAVYKKPLPSRFLASFSKFIHENSSELYLSDLVTGCFSQFLDTSICKYPQHKYTNLSCVGSVAYYFSTFLKTAAKQKGITLDKIIQSPIDDMVLYHFQKKSDK